MVKNLFWTPLKIKTRSLVIIASLSCVVYGLAFSGMFIKPSSSDPRLKAAETTAKAFELIRRAHPAPNAKVDPLGSGIIGIKESPITSKWGFLAAKQTTINPNWAAVFVDLYRESGFRPGDAIILGVSGSFPALNIASIIAAETMNLHPVVISSVMSSQWGANDENFTWLDMEKTLADAGVIKTRSVAASLGGRGDQALGMPAGTVELIKKIIDRNGIPEVDEANIQEAVNRRLDLIKHSVGTASIKAYVNIGGGQASLGGKRSRKVFHPGVNAGVNGDVLEDMAVPPSVAQSLIIDGATFINITGIRELAKRYDLPWQPQIMPLPGEGGIFAEESPRWYAAGILLMMMVMLVFARLRFELSKKAHIAASMPVALEPEKIIRQGATASDLNLVTSLKNEPHQAHAEGHEQGGHAEAYANAHIRDAVKAPAKSTH